MFMTLISSHKPPKEETLLLQHTAHYFGAKILTHNVHLLCYSKADTLPFLQWMGITTEHSPFLTALDVR